LVDKKIDYYYLPCVQPSQKARRKHLEEFGERKISKLTNHVEDIVIREGQFQSFDLKLKKLVASDDLPVMDELANKDIEDMVISDNFLKATMEDYLGVPLHTMVKVLKVIDDDELKFEVRECVEELQ
jgi:predicted ATPase